MERTTLVETLKSVSLAVANKDLVPILACFCFDGEEVVGYDDLVAISCPCPADIKGAVNAKTLLGYLGATTTDDVKFKQTSKNLKVTAGKGDITLPILSEDEFIFEFPETKKATTIPFDDALVDALEASILSMGLDPGHPWRLGVTVVFEEDMVTMYSSDNLTASEVITPLEEKLDKKSLPGDVVLPPRFCQLLTTMASREIPVELVIGKGWVQANFESGAKLFTRTSDSADVELYQQTFDSLLPEGYEEDAADTPEGAAQALERALVILQSSPDKKVTMNVKGNSLQLTATSPLGKFNESLPFKGHHEASAVVGPELMLRALPVSEKLLMTGNAVLFIAADFVHIVTSIQE